MGGASKYSLGTTSVCQALHSEGWAEVEKEGRQDSGKEPALPLPHRVLALALKAPKNSKLKPGL